MQCFVSARPPGDALRAKPLHIDLSIDPFQHFNEHFLLQLPTTPPHHHLAGDRNSWDGGGGGSFGEEQVAVLWTLVSAWGNNSLDHQFLHIHHKNYIVLHCKVNHTSVLHAAHTFL